MKTNITFKKMNIGVFRDYIMETEKTNFWTG